MICRGLHRPIVSFVLLYDTALLNGSRVSMNKPGFSFIFVLPHEMYLVQNIYKCAKQRWARREKREGVREREAKRRSRGYGASVKTTQQTESLAFRVLPAEKLIRFYIRQRPHANIPRDEPSQICRFVASPRILRSEPASRLALIGHRFAFTSPIRNCLFFSRKFMRELARVHFTISGNEENGFSSKKQSFVQCTKYVESFCYVNNPSIKCFLCSSQIYEQFSGVNKLFEIVKNNENNF